MVFDIVPLIILFVALSVIGLVVWRRLPYVSHLKVEETPEHQQAVVKQTILEDRLRRKLKEFTSWLWRHHIHLLPRIGLKSRLQKYWQALVKREEAWRLSLFRRSHPAIQAEQLGEGLKEAANLLIEQKLVEAEEKLLLLIRLAPRHRESYRLLAQVYELQKNWRDAAEAFRFAIGEEITNEEDYLYLGELYRQAGDHRQALEMFQEAYKLDPRDPKNLDFLCEESILQNNLKLARQALSILKEVNPENQKIEVFEERLRGLKK
mgnify:CR=1 FL=1